MRRPKHLTLKSEKYEHCSGNMQTDSIVDVVNNLTKTHSISSLVLERVFAARRATSDPAAISKNEITSRSGAASPPFYTARLGPEADSCADLMINLGRKSLFPMITTNQDPRTRGRTSPFVISSNDETVVKTGSIAVALHGTSVHYESDSPFDIMEIWSRYR